MYVLYSDALYKYQSLLQPHKQATPPDITGIHDSTLISESPAADIPPPPDSPPPLPPDYPPPNITQDDLSIGSVGPAPISVSDSCGYTNNTNGGSPSAESTPSLTIQIPTPEPTDDRYLWRADSFDDFGDENEESVV